VKAEQLAELAGVTLGAPTSIVETFSSPPVPYALGAQEFAASADTATPIAPGTQEVAVTLSVQYSIGG